MTDQIEYVEDTTGHAPHADAPVAVTVVDAVRVQEFPAQSWTATQQTINVGQPTSSTVPAHHARVSLGLTNHGANTIYLAPQPETCTPTQGYPLAAGDSLTLQTRAAVYACAGFASDGVTPQPSTLGVLAEFRDGHA